MGAVKNAMVRDGLDPNILDMDPDKPLNSEEPEDTGPPLKEDPKYAKYFKMLKLGLPIGAVKNAITRDGLDPAVMDLDHDKSLASQLDPKKKDAKKGPVKPKGPKIRRKKVYWNQLDANEGTVWSALKQLEIKLKLEKEEFEELFAQIIDAKKEKDKKQASEAKKSKASKTVKVIDAKRGMNGDILLRKVKLTAFEVATMVEHMDPGVLDPTELRSMYEFMPNDEEKQGLTAYMNSQKGKSREEAMEELTPCEQYMVAMNDLKDSERKFQGMIFMAEFPSKLSDIKYEVDNLIAACAELNDSERFQTLLAMVLVLVNKINIGDEDPNNKKAQGFTLESLSKLSETKAFDNKTTVLHYLIKVIRSTNIDILKFTEDIKSVVLAKGVVMERLLTSAKQLCEDSRIITETATKEGEEYRHYLKNPDANVVDKNGQNTGKKYEKREVKAQRQSVKELRQMCTFLPEKDVPVGSSDTTHFERFALFSKLELQKALGIIKEANQDYIGVLEYFGEDMKTQTTDFFGMIDTFMESFDKVADVVEKEEEAKAKEARRELARQAKLKAKAESDSPEDAEKIANATGDDEDGATPVKKPSWRDKPILKAPLGEPVKATDPKKPSDDVNPDPRAALMSMLNNKRGGVSADEPEESTTSDDTNPDPRTALVNMLASRGAVPADEPNESTKEEKEENLDPRAALMSMLNNKRGGASADEPEELTTSDDTNPDPRTALMNMLASRGAVPADEPKEEKKEKEEIPDPRAALMSMLNKRAAPQVPYDEQKSSSPTTPPPAGGIAAMAAAAARKKEQSNSQSSSLAPEEDDANPDPRAALMSMLNKRAPPLSNLKKLSTIESVPSAIGSSSSEGEDNPDPRAALTSMFNKRAPPTSSTVKEPKKLPVKVPSSAEKEGNEPDPRAALMSMLNKRAPPTPPVVTEPKRLPVIESDDKPANDKPADPPAALMSMLNKRAPPATDELSRPAIVTPPTGKSPRLLDAVANASAHKVVEESPQPAVVSTPPAQKSSRLLAAVQAASAPPKVHIVEESPQPSNNVSSPRTEEEPKTGPSKKLSFQERAALSARKKEERMERERAAHEQLAAMANREAERLAAEEAARLEQERIERERVQASQKSTILEKFEAEKRKLAEAKKAKEIQEKEQAKIDREKELRARYEAEMAQKSLEREQASEERLERERKAAKEDERVASTKKVARSGKLSSLLGRSKKDTKSDDRSVSSVSVKDQIRNRERETVDKQLKEVKAAKLVEEANRLKAKLASNNRSFTRKNSKNSNGKGTSKLLAAVQKSESKLSQQQQAGDANTNFIRSETNGTTTSKKSNSSARSRLSMAVARAQQKQNS